MALPHFSPNANFPEGSMKVIVADSRDLTDYDVVRKALDEARENGLEKGDPN